MFSFYVCGHFSKDFIDTKADRFADLEVEYARGKSPELAMTTEGGDEEIIR